ncbi:glycosyltransferase family 2 protein [Undibacterium oligocarboniphilum]|nr:glycosyltransferase family 2 protein [Undibacterium oligocarboniphilum]
MKIDHDQFGISVVIPTFNRKEPLMRAVESVKTNRPNCVEIIVVDDGSDTYPKAFLPEMNVSGVPVRVYGYKKNGGAQKARNLGIRRSKYRYIAFLDSDDAFFEKKIDIVLDSLSENPVDILFHSVKGMEKYAQLVEIWLKFFSWVIPLHWLITVFNPVVTPSLVLRRKQKLGLSLRFCEDWSYLLHYIEPNMTMKYLPENLSEVFRAVGSKGGISSAIWNMRKGEFYARSVLLKKNTFSNVIRYLFGSIFGGARILNDLIRLRYLK